MFVSRLTILTILLSISAAIVASPTPTATAATLRPALQARVSIPPPQITPPKITPVSITPVSLSLDLPTSTCTQTIKPDKNGYVPPNTCGSLYHFYPSYGAAIAASVLFGIVTTLHIGQAAYHKKRFCWVIIMGGFWELGSFVTRSLSTRDQQSSGLAMIAQLLLLLAPLWVNAFCYMVLGRMVQFFIPTHAIFRIRASTLAMYFVGLDIVSFIIQLVGGGMAGNGQPPETIKKGIDIYMGGIGLQEFFIIVFLAFAIKFHLQMLAMEKRGELVGTGKEKWRILLYALYTSLLLISVRIIFRLIEFSRGNKPDNPIPYNEKYLYFLDVLPMFLAIAVMNVAHPGRFLIGPESELPKANWRKKRALRKNAKKRLIDDEYEEMVTRVPVDAQGNKRPT